MKPLYRGGLHPWTSAHFHAICDNQGPTLTLFQSKAGRLFGGFTSVSWDARDPKAWAEDKDAFIFSLDRREVYPVLNPKEAVFLAKEWGPSFGGSQLGVQGGLMNSENAG